MKNPAELPPEDPRVDPARGVRRLSRKPALIALGVAALALVVLLEGVLSRGRSRTERPGEERAEAPLSSRGALEALLADIPRGRIGPPPGTGDGPGPAPEAGPEPVPAASPGPDPAPAAPPPEEILPSPPAGRPGAAARARVPGSPTRLPSPSRPSRCIRRPPLRQASRSRSGFLSPCPFPLRSRPRPGIRPGRPCGPGRSAREDGQAVPPLAPAAGARPAGAQGRNPDPRHPDERRPLRPARTGPGPGRLPGLRLGQRDAPAGPPGGPPVRQLRSRAGLRGPTGGDRLGAPDLPRRLQPDPGGDEGTGPPGTGGGARTRCTAIWAASTDRRSCSRRSAPGWPSPPSPGRWPARWSTWAARRPSRPRTPPAGRWPSTWGRTLNRQLERSIDIQPTLVIRAGKRMALMVERDVGFERPWPPGPPDPRPPRKPPRYHHPLGAAP